MTRHWRPCRSCGATHNNPNSSSICTTCGISERNERIESERREWEEFESSAFGQFMNMSEEDRWREIFERLSLDTE